MKRAVAVALLATCTACAASPATKGATVEGDVYLVTQGGDTKRGAGLVVSLAEADSVSPAIRSICAALQDRIGHSIELMASTNKRAGYWLTEAERAKSYSLSTSRDFADSAQRYVDSTRAIVRADTTASAVAQRQIYALLDSAGHARKAQTGIDAHYRFANVPRGRYLLQAEWRIANHGYWWLVPIAVLGDSVRKDLDNAAIDAHLCVAERRP